GRPPFAVATAPRLRVRLGAPLCRELLALAAGRVGWHDRRRAADSATAAAVGRRGRHGAAGGRRRGLSVGRRLGAAATAAAAGAAAAAAAGAAATTAAGLGLGRLG